MDELSRRPRRRWLGALTGTNLSALALLFLIERFVAERHWLATFLTYIPQWPFLVPAVLLLLAALVRRDRRSALVNAGALVLGLVVLLGFRFALPLRPAASERLRVMTFNILHGERGTEQIAAVIRAAAPDVICLQETNAFRALPDPKPALRRALPGYDFAEHGELMVASRHPIRSRQVRPLGTLRTRRPALEVVLDVRGQPVTVLCVHLATFVTGASLTRRGGRSLPEYLRATSAIREEQTAALLFGALMTSTPLVVAGDFNTPPRGRVYGCLTETFYDAFAERGRGLGYTYPADHPQMRIDYVFSRGGALPADARVPVERAASDHRPLIAEIALPARRP